MTKIEPVASACNASEQPFINRTALVTGGTGGVGRAVVSMFAQAGARVVATYYRNREAAEQYPAWGSRSSGTQFCQAQLNKPEGAIQLCERVRESVHSIDYVVHCAATGIHKHARNIGARDVQRVLNVNILSFVDIVCSLGGILSSDARIIGISSLGSSRGLAQYGTVGASKGMLEAYIRQLAAEMAGSGVTANCVSPGLIPTAAIDAFPERDAIVSATLQRTPTKRLTTAEDVASLIGFLCTPAGRQINGQSIVIDGGFSIAE